MASIGEIRATVEAATQRRHPGTAVQPAKFALILHELDDPVERARTIAAALAPIGATVEPLSNLDPRVLVATFPERAFAGPDGAAFAAAHRFEEAFDLAAAEPDLPTDLFPDAGIVDEFTREDVGNFPPGCFAPAEAALPADWAITAIRAPDAWAFSTANQRPAQGVGTIVAQPDTGVTAHAELAGITTVGGFDVLDNDPDPTDPLDGENPGHGTGTASVVVSGPAGTVTGSAPGASHMAIRAVESVVRITQVSVARSIDWAIDHGAHVITLSLGGIFSFTLQRALRRAVQADVIVLAAAGNCVGLVVWPARYDECIAVAGVDARGVKWRGSCSGAAVDISAPAENVWRAALPERRRAGPGHQLRGGADRGGGRAVAGPPRPSQPHRGRPSPRGDAAGHVPPDGRGDLATTGRLGLLRRWAPASSTRSALLSATDFDVDRDRESADAPAGPRESAEVGVASLAAEEIGPAAALQDPPGLVPARSRAQLAVVAGPARPPGSGRAGAGGTGRSAVAVPRPGRRRRQPGPARRAGTGWPGQRGRRRGRHRGRGRRTMTGPMAGDRLRRLVTARSRADEVGAGLESVPVEEAAPPGAAEVTGRVEEAAPRLAESRGADDPDFRRALDVLLRTTDRAARRLDNNPEAALPPDEMYALEAVVRADGTRPSLLVRGGAADPGQPLAATWAEPLAGAGPELARAIAAVGRVEPAHPTGSDFFGTCWVVDQDNGLVLTNLHVLLAMAKRLPHAMARTATGFQVFDGAFVDFAAESGSADMRRYRVVEATPSGTDGTGFARLDAAVLRIEPLPDGPPDMPGGDHRPRPTRTGRSAVSPRTASSGTRPGRRR